MKIHLLAHGRQDRLPIATPKQLLKVNGEAIIERTLRLIRERAYPKPVVVASESWNAFCRKNRLERRGFDPLPDIPGSVGAIVSEPGDHLFLLGDVVFSESAIDLVLSSGPAWAVYGKPGPNVWTGKGRSENYALWIPDGFRERVSSFAAMNHDRGERKLSFMAWELSIPLVEVRDWTDDVDDTDDLENVLPKLDSYAKSEY